MLLATDAANPWIAYAVRMFEAVPWLWFMLGMMAVDFASGVAASAKMGKLSSKVGFAGAMKRAAAVLVVLATVIAEQSAKMQIPEAMRNTIPIPLAAVVATFFMWADLISVLENARKCGVALPNFLQKSLEENIKRLSNSGVTTSETVSLNITNAKIKAELTHTETDSKILRGSDSADSVV